MELKVKAIMWVVIVALIYLIIPNLFLNVESKEVTTSIHRYNPDAHYEFDSKEIYTIREKRIYSLRPPFLTISAINDHFELALPKVAVYFDYSPKLDECFSITKNRENTSLYITSKINYFSESKCTMTLIIETIVDEPATISLGGWRSDYEESKRYTEQSFIIKNKHDSRIDEFVFKFNNFNETRITNITECKNISVFLDEKEVQYKKNFFGSNSTIATTFSLENLEAKSINIRCYEN